jgi:hypothetical protein
MADEISPAPADYQRELDYATTMSFEALAPIAKRGVAWWLLLLDVFLFLSLGMSTGWHLRLVPTLFLAGLALYAVFGAIRTPKKRSRKPHRVQADERGLSIDGVMYVERAAIESAYCVADGSGTDYAVHVEGRSARRACTVYVDSKPKGDALLAALRADSASAAGHFRALPPWAKHMRWLVILLTASPWVLINLLRLIPAWGLSLIGALYAVILLPTLLPQRVDVGHDGVFLRWLGNKRFIPFSAIDIATSSKLGVDLFLRGDKHVEIRLTQKDGAAAAQVNALLARIKEGIAMHSGLGRADEEAFLARQARDLDTWMRDMRALGAAEVSGYRAAAIPRDRLWAVVENPAADASAREGAALALSASLDAEDRARLAQLAQKTAQPRLRIALEGVSHAEDAPRLRVALETAESTELDEPSSSPEPELRSRHSR